jgi:2-dehydro-3-deoxy-L-rhamnonate dehydrogenase (NAD+)
VNQIDLSGRVLVVTGGARGIGYAVAQRALESKGSVALWDVDAERLEQAKEALSKLGKVSAHIVELTDEASVNAATQATIDAHGQIDGLINNAGITGGNGTLWELPVDTWRRVIDVNLIGPYLTCRAIVPHMIKQGYGRIVNVASVAAKAGLIGLTKSLGKELATKGILVNAVTPAAARTEIFNSMTQQHIDYMLQRIPMSRFLEPEEAAAMIVWLSSQDCAFSTAAVFDLSGGRATY